MSLLHRISQQGWMYSVAILFNRVVPKWLFRCRRYVVYQLEIQPPLAADSVGNHGFEIGWCESEEQTQAVEQLTYFKRDFSAGPARAVQASFNGKLVGGFWAATQIFDEDELGVRVVLEPQQAWLFAALVSRDCRGRGVYSKILQFITSQLANEGFTQPLVAVNPNNKPSHRVHKKNAREFVGTVWAARFLNFSICLSGKPVEQKSWFTLNSKHHPIEISFPASGRIRNS